MLTPSSYYVESLAFSPDGKEIAFAASPQRGFMAQYTSPIFAVPVTGGTPRPAMRLEWFSRWIR